MKKILAVLVVYSPVFAMNANTRLNDVETRLTNVENVVAEHDTQLGENISVIGSIGKLGCWDSCSSLNLNWNEGNIWTGSFDYNEDKVFIGETKDYICHLYNNGAEIFQPITFSIVNTEDNIVPIENYDFAITSDNTFTIKNKKMYNKAPLLIEAQVIINEQTIKDTIEIWLGGLF